ncbi:hypothetical protein BDP27DRAFT_1358278 [Rhodocollybia butyracea]|uniref:Transmembrane protein 135 N-terminal domain-containing protein n=1 Tax=Rhodocollybia butyracea TaxID=206335 RepID=A0A9P5Q9M8_9AGAR|nr:hypothetical protein BDP27DRAFT_1358278 [Rhodocollybia butyracea]
MALVPNDLLDRLPELSDDPTHPSQIAIRTYGLALSLSLGPSLIPFLLSIITRRRSQKTGLAALRKVLRRELGYDGFAFAVTVAVGGGAALRRLWESFDRDQQRKKRSSWLSRLNNRLSSCQKTFIANVLTSSLSILLLSAGRRRSERLRNIPRPGALPIPYTWTPSNPNSNLNPNLSSSPSPTLDLTLLVLVRAIDVALQSLITKFTNKPEAEVELAKGKRSNKEKVKLTTRLDALVFWACSARIMWCFFYEPQRLPSTYVKWIRTLAAVDSRLLRALRLIRSGEWTYSRGSSAHASLLTTYAKDLGYPSTWGDPLFVGHRGVPCELVHGGTGSMLGLDASCTANAGIRGLKAFLEAILVYLPAHFIPVLITRPQVLLRPYRVFTTLLSTFRSAAFLSTFVASFWASVCFTRTLALAPLFPSISHEFWDGPLGCILAGCLMCGSSIWIENGRRRGEMALYVLPRAIRASLPDGLVKSRKGIVLMLERLTFMLSLSTLLTAAIHKPESLRGLSRWGLSFIMSGPHAGFWQRRRRNFETRPSTPRRIDTPSPGTPEADQHQPSS